MNAPLLPSLLARRPAGPAPTADAAAEARSAFAQRLGELPVALAHLDRDGTVRWCNARFAEQCGQTVDSITGASYLTLRDVPPPADGETCPLRDALASGQPHTGQYPLSLGARRAWFRVTLDPEPGSGRWCLVETPDTGGSAAVDAGDATSDDALAVLDRERERYQRIFECASAALLMVDNDSRVLACNPMAERLMGMPRHQVVGRVLHEVLNWAMHDINGEPVPIDQLPSRQALRQGRSTRNRVVNVCSGDGRRRWISISTTPVPGDDGSVWAVSSFIDVTDRIEGERQRAEQWRQTQAIISGSRLGVWHARPADGTLFMDEQCLQLADLDTGLSPRELVSRWAQNIHPDDRNTVWEAINDLSRGAKTFTFVESRMRLRDGGWRWLRTRAHTVSRAGGVDGLMLAGTVEDISELKQHEAAARHSDALLQALFDQAPIGIQLLNLTTGLTARCNPALSAITGYPPEHIMRTSADERSRPDTVARRVQWRHQLLTRGRSGPHEFEVQHADGSWRQVRCSAVSVSDLEGRPFAWALVEDISDRKQLEQRLKMAATQDNLTGLPNRAAMLAHLQGLLERRRHEPGFGFATLFLDFDRFKLVNDTLGHAVGDELLCEIADRIRGVVPAEDGWLAARFGGDEFVIVVPGADTAERTLPFTQQLVETFRPAYLIGGHELLSSASIGVSLAADNETDSETLLREADTAMYEAKRRGRAQVVFYDAAMHQRLHRSVQLEAGLRTAIERNELQVVYQPIVDLNDRRMASAEALLRWTHPTLGPISPAEFIPIAEESGHILALGEWVLREACREWIIWDLRDPQRRPETVSVNLSRVQLQLGPRLVELVRTVLEQCGMPARHLQLEVTEREVMLQQSDMAQLLHQLHALGIRLAMDDFGTGASSLGCLREFPFDVIKIDKSFMADLSHDVQALAIAQATIHVIENLGMRSVAEGVENLDDVATLQSLGCQFGQGYLFCRPVPGDDLLDGWQ
jgi:diguanylate cyclase (GGDEF)-like protein/PAS domain S-box-containing protein